ncbi:MAG: hypothetical protein L7V87_01065 [Verrucomicrobiales bacterium]|nr:hypothetical protein [Verrucomicrobiales bacterium]
MNEWNEARLNPVRSKTESCLVCDITLLRLVAVAGVAIVATASFGQDADLTPGPIESSDFEALKEASPFGRVLDPAEVYVLRGVASFDDIQMATVYNRQTEKTVLVTPEKETEEGLQLVEVSQPPSAPEYALAAVSARISFAGDEVELRYEESQILPQPRPDGGGDGRRNEHGKGDDGKRKGPSKEDVARYRALPQEKQQKLREYIGHVMRSYPNISREERGNMIRGAMIRLTDGQDLDVPKPPEKK